MPKRIQQKLGATGDGRVVSGNYGPVDHGENPKAGSCGLRGQRQRGGGARAVKTNEVPARKGGFPSLLHLRRAAGGIRRKAGGGTGSKAGDKFAAVKAHSGNSFTATASESQRESRDRQKTPPVDPAGLACCG
jgi:hypothetical protein